MNMYTNTFSRGSFAARVLAGMIERVGLLNKGLIYMTPTAWEMYSNWEYAGQPLVNDPKITLIEDFTKSFTRNKFDFEFMGLWDSVNSVGLVVDKLFPFTTTTYNVKHVRHALSIDERRAKFKQLMIQSYSDLENVSVENSDASSLGLIVTAASNLLRKVFQPGLKNTKPSLRHSDDIVEMFFPGDHSDCGGGWIIDDEGVCLSDISLRWMLLEAIVAGVKFKTGAINKFDSQNPVLPSLLSHHHDLLSVEPPKSFVNDKVAGVPTEPLDRYEGRGEQSIFASLGWWAVELLPIQMKYEDENGEWKRGFEPNLGRNRLIPKECRLHWSFFYRVHYIADYKPNHTIAEERYGHYMLELLATHKGLFKGKDLEKYCSKLNLDVIRNDYDNEIWKIIPNDLQVCLELNPSL